MGIKDVFQLAFPKAAHKKERVGIFDGTEWTQYFHPDFCVRGDWFG